MAKLDLGYKTEELYTPGTLFEAHIPGYNDRFWTVLTLQVIWEDGEQPYQHLTLLAIDPKSGEDVGEEPVKVNSDTLDIRVI